MKSLTRTFLKGLAVLLPITVTVYVLWWLGTTAEATMKAAWRFLLPPDLYRPGLGVAAGVALVFGAGVVMNLWFARRLVRLAERVVERVPLVKTLYGSVKDLMGFFSGPGDGKSMNQVVLVDLEPLGTRLLGFLTREALPELESDGEVAVYLPMSYQIGGFTVMVPRERITSVSMTVEEGMRFAMTAGVSNTSRAAPED